MAEPGLNPAAPAPGPAAAGWCARVPGKVVLLGEYVVLEGAPAMVAAVDRFVTVAARPAPAWQLEAVGLGWPTVALEVDAAGTAHPAAGTPSGLLGRLGPLCEAVGEGVQWSRAQGRPLAPQALRVDSRAFHLEGVRPRAGSGGTKLGLGSSAAVVVATVAALAAAAGLQDLAAPSEAERRDLFCRAERAHRRAQGGRGSGADVAAAVYGGVITYQRPPGSAPEQAVVQRLDGRATVGWQAVYSGHPASTVSLLGQTARLRQAEPARYWQIFEQLGILARAGCEFWALGEALAFMHVVERYQATLGLLGSAAQAPIVTPAHAGAEALVRRLGGTYKVSGAGGGDLGLSFWSGGRPPRRLGRDLRALRLVPVPLAVSPAGAQVVAT